MSFIFVGQYLLYEDAQARVGMNNSEIRFSPYAIFSTACLAVGLGAVLLYHSRGGARFGRLYLDVPRSVQEGERREQEREERGLLPVSTAILSSP